MIAFNIASSGMATSLTRMGASAANTAAAVTTVPSDGAGGYRPVDAVSSAQPGGGVSTRLVARDPAAIDRYDPTAADADAGGMVSAPAVNLVDEGVAQLESMLTYQANASVVRAGDAMERATIDLTA